MDSLHEPLALRRARVLDWVDSLPQGLDTYVGEHGAQVSGGQRQRIALARALLADFPILLLDEPAEHLDPDTADALVTSLLTGRHTAGGEARGVVVVTHRLTPLAAADEVLWVENGRIVELREFMDSFDAVQQVLGREIFGPAPLG